MGPRKIVCKAVYRATSSRRLGARTGKPDAGTTKTSRAHCFDARIDTQTIDRDLLRQAFEARRNAVDVSVFAHQLMVARGLESAEPPKGTQWTAVIGDALNEEFAAAEFPFRPRIGGPKQASA